MSFRGFPFVLFLIIALVGWRRLLPSPKARCWLLGLSLLFYGCWWPIAPFILVLSGSIDFVLARRIAASSQIYERKFWLTLSILINVAILAVWKYGGPAAAILLGNNEWAARVGADAIPRSFPIAGVSFYALQSISYCVDVYRGDLKPSRSLVSFLLYLSFFPRLLAGPIVRGGDFFDRLDHVEPPTLERSTGGLYLFTRGLFKKVLADAFGRIVTAEFLAVTTGSRSGLEAVVVMLYFSGQIYYDFSSYSDIARGLGRMFGIELPRNFDLPYLAEGPGAFWRRWNITLSSWLRDYVYIPLGGNRGGALRQARNILVTFLVGGIWHGAAWTFLLWSLVSGVLVLIERGIVGRARTVDPSKAAAVLGRCLRIATTFAAISLTWVLFHATTVGEALQFYRHLLQGSWQVARLDGLNLGLLAWLPITHFLGVMERRHGRWRGAPIVRAVATGVAGAIVFLGPQEESDFLYYHF